MRNTIEGFRQDYLLKLHLLQSDAVILRWMLSFFQSKNIEYIDIIEDGKEERYYWIKYTKLIEDLPTLYITNKVVIGKMLKRICGEGKENENQYPLKKYTNWDHKKLGNKTYFRFRPDILALMETTMNGFGLELPNPRQEKSYGSLNPNVERILVELDKLHLPDNRKLFSFTMPTDHKIHTKSMKRFQDCLYDLFEGRFNSRNKIAEWFYEKNQYYITNETFNYIKECKGNWAWLANIIVISAKKYISWFEKDRETVNKEWLTRDIGSWMYYSIKQTSMFYISIIHKATKTREVIAEKTFNNLPSNIANLFNEFYKDEWDGLNYWNKIYSVYKWYKDNAKNLMAENINYSYWLDKGINEFMKEYYDFINIELGTKYLKHFGTKCNTWNWFINTKKEEHGIDE